MSTDNICLYKEVARKYTCCNLKTTELLNCALIGVCEVSRSNTVILPGILNRVDRPSALLPRMDSE